jgi:hypothetical protein
MHSIRRADTGHAQRDGRHKIYRFLTAFLMSSNPQVRDIHDMGQQRLHKKKAHSQRKRERKKHHIALAISAYSIEKKTATSTAGMASGGGMWKCVIPGKEGVTFRSTHLSSLHHEISSLI